LNVSRTNEVLGARYEEISNKTWVLSKERMKADREHRVPLSAATLKLLEPNGTGLIFPNPNTGEELSENHCWRCCRRKRT
jgi:integrase